MKRVIPILLFLLTACNVSDDPQPQTGTTPTADNSRNALDWQGVYTGTVPCADCAGIRTRIELSHDGSFARSLLYVGRDEQPFDDVGTFVWDDSGSRITLDPGDREAQQYQVGENVLFHLDRDGQRISGDLAAAYRLEKIVQDPRIENRPWQLIELNGQPVEPPADRGGAYLQLDSTQRSVTGNASCNRFVGPYELHAGDRLRIGPDIASTRMACPELNQESAFLAVLAQVDNYTIADGILSLNDGMAALAGFSADGDSPPEAQ
jgi:copper homeostasis protein (lipoprotein)